MQSVKKKDVILPKIYYKTKKYGNKTRYTEGYT